MSNCEQYEHIGIYYQVDINSKKKTKEHLTANKINLLHNLQYILAIMYQILSFRSFL